jgi:hypothetical protein
MINLKFAYSLLHITLIQTIFMKNIFTLLVAFFMAAMAIGKSVTMESARSVADNYYRHNSTAKSSNLNLKDAYSKSFNGLTTFYIFNYQAGGFVIVAADDAVTPILAESNTGYFDSEMSDPAVRYWFDGYNKQIADIVSAKYDNSQTLKEWNKIQANDVKSAISDVGPLLLTAWDQGCFYNTQCPADAKSTSSCGHTWTGCVATTMSQLLKYNNFPAHGYLSHSYVHATYGKQTANFASTTFDWASMSNHVTSANASVAAIMYQAGVSVDMDYGAKASGAFSENVPWALVTYFNYDPSTISFRQKANYTATQWSNMLKAELDAHRPLYYSGNDDSTGHAWVCDGYSSIDGKFHFNWGWSGTYNGYFAIGALNPGGYQPNQNNAVIIGIKPGNPNLVARITNISNDTVLFADAPVPIDVSIVEGTANTVKLFVDKNEIYATSQATFTYHWSTAGIAPGIHTLKVVAMNATDTVYFPVTFSVNGWIKQSTGFATASRGIQYIHAVDSLVVWAIAYDGSGAGATTNEITRTADGGNTWTPGQVLGGPTYGLGNICGLNANIAYVTLYNGASAQDNTCGVYKTGNGGTTWTHLTGALQGSTSFADNVWFWNENEGMCHGDVSGTGTAAYFEIYTTSNGGTTWTRVPKASIGGGATPASGEGGWTSVIQAVGNTTIMFGTNKARLYISHDRGHTWTISNTGIAPSANGGINKIAFKDELNGLVAQTSGTVVVKETHDGGASWQIVTATGFLTNDLTYVKGTDNTFVCTGATGASYSFDGGHTWQVFKGTELSKYLATAWVNNRTGWAGGYSVSATDGGMYKYKGALLPTAPLATPGNLKATFSGNDVMVTWDVPVTSGIVTGYNVYRDGILLTTAPVLVLFYQDAAVGNGNYNYCVAAIYDNGESAQVCTAAALAIGENEHPEQQVRVYPNPGMGQLYIDSDLPFSSVQILNIAGQVIYSNVLSGHHLQISTSEFQAGMYLVRVQIKDGFISRKISVK